MVGGTEPEGKAGEQRGDIAQGPLGANLERTREGYTSAVPPGAGELGSIPHLRIIRVGLLPWGRYSQGPPALAESCRRGHQLPEGPRAQGAGSGRGSGVSKVLGPGGGPLAPARNGRPGAAGSAGARGQDACQLQGPTVHSLRSLWPPPRGRLPRLHHERRTGLGHPGSWLAGALTALRIHTRRS